MKMLTDKIESLSISQGEIDKINEKHIGIKRAARRILKDAIEIGRWFVEAQSEIFKAGGRPAKGRPSKWAKFIEQNFARIGATAVWKYMLLARNQEFLIGIHDEERLGINEAVELIRKNERQQKRYRRKPKVSVIAPDAEPLVMLEAKLKNFAICLWQLRYLQAEIEELICLTGLTNQETQQALEIACREHREIKEEVLSTFQTKRLIDLNICKDA